MATIKTTSIDGEMHIRLVDVIAFLALVPGETINKAKFVKLLDDLREGRLAV